MLYDQNAAAVRTFVHRRVDSDLADDVTAEVFLIAWRRLDQAPADALAWLLGIARGLLSNERRAQARRLKLYARLAHSTPRTQHGSTEPRATDAPWVFRALELIGPRDREILLLVAWDGLDRRQAAQAMGLTTAQFAVRLHRARRRFEKALDHEPQAGSTAAPHPTSEVLDA